MANAYDTIRSSIQQSGNDARVEVNQRALIDKILARYASAGAVYRELLQNSNDAEAQVAEIHFTTVPTPNGPFVIQVVYRNDGIPFRPQDWNRLRKIAEGNPDVAKVGAFGVGAYTMFSMAEEPLVISGNQALAFTWKGDALWVKTGNSPSPSDRWTSFVLPSRDPYPLPNLVEFGRFLCSNLTFTEFLKHIIVFVDQTQQLSIKKTDMKPPTMIQIPKSSWWKNEGAQTKSPLGVFSLANDQGSFMETTIQIEVKLDDKIVKKPATYVFAEADVNIPHDMKRRMIRVTKKDPPPRVKIQVFTDAGSSSKSDKESDAAKIVDAFSPRMGNGSIFIGFKTSQTTGLGAHLAAPFIPTVEREAIDLQDQTLMKYNSELLHMGGVVMRLTLEHSMLMLDKNWQKNTKHREQLEKHLKKQNLKTGNHSKSEDSIEQQTNQTTSTEDTNERPSMFSFARFMASGARKIAEVISSVENRLSSDDFLTFADTFPLSKEEWEGIVLMRAFSPQQSTPDSRVGAFIAEGFETCLSSITPPVLTQTGVIRGSDSLLPHLGIERFMRTNVVREPILKNAESYHIHVAMSRPLNIDDLVKDIKKQVLEEDEIVTLVKWWTQFAAVERQKSSVSLSLKNNISFRVSEQTNKSSNEKNDSHNNSSKRLLKDVLYFLPADFTDKKVPVPHSVIPQTLQTSLTTNTLSHRTLEDWFRPLTFSVWFHWIIKHPALYSREQKYHQDRVHILAVLSKEFSKSAGDKQALGKVFHDALFKLPCIPSGQDEHGNFLVEKPGEVYLASAELSIFSGISEFKKIPPSLITAGVTEEFLTAIGVRRAIAVELLLTHLDTLKWNNDPKPLISYLQSAELSEEDMEKLQNIQYLPEVSDNTRLYSPQELHLPHTSLSIFPFVKVLQWHSSERFNEHSKEAEFLRELGCMDQPPLVQVLDYISSKISDDIRLEALTYVAKKLSTDQDYIQEYKDLMHIRFLPVQRLDLQRRGKHLDELQSPERCYISSSCLCMGFSVLQSAVDTRCGPDAALRFGCKRHPSSDRLVTQLLDMYEFAKKKNLWSTDIGDAKDHNDAVLQTFSQVFKYLTTRVDEFSESEIKNLSRVRFIPVLDGDKLSWYSAEEIYFEGSTQSDGMASALFPTVEFSPFLNAIGVRAEPSVEDLCELLIASPKKVFSRLKTEDKYKMLLRRIASHPPSKRTIRRLRMVPFLLGYKANNEMENKQAIETADATQDFKPTYTLARPEEICIIDNSLFARMFHVISAPQETDLEKFYEGLGALPLSKCIITQYTVGSYQKHSTLLTYEFSNRLKERAPILVSPSATSRSLVKNAADILAENNLSVIEVTSITAHYAYKGEKKSEAVTCCSSHKYGRKNTLYITENLQWYDVGSTLGKLILQRCNVEDAFFLGVVLESSLEQLKARGFPVDRVTHAAEPAPTLELEESNVTEKSPSPKQKPAVKAREPTNAPVVPPPQPKSPMTNETETIRHNKSLFGRALRSFSGKTKHHSSHGNTKGASSSIEPHVDDHRHSHTKKSGTHEHTHNQPHSSPKVPPNDSEYQNDLDQVLKDSIRSVKEVSKSGIYAPEDKLIPTPPKMQNHNTCEIVSGKDLVPFKSSNGSRKTANGMRVFATRQSEASINFLQQNWQIVEKFSLVLAHIGDIYGIRLDSIAIFHDPTSTTIAFNSNRSLYFNIRLFFSLHFKESSSADFDCYSYWYVITAHELAHNLVKAHDQRHGFYTESYISNYMKKFLNVVSLLGLN